MLLLPVAGEQPAQTIRGEVVGISDGDTFDVLTADKAKIRIRLNGIDSPETGQPFGRNAKQFLSDHAGGKDVRVVTHGEDRYGRTIGDVYAGASLINMEIVRAGLAWHYVKYAPDDKALAAAELEARESKRGLWSPHIERRLRNSLPLTEVNHRGIPGLEPPQSIPPLAPQRHIFLSTHRSGLLASMRFLETRNDTEPVNYGARGRLLCVG